MASNFNGAVAGITQDNIEFANFPAHEVNSNHWKHADITPIDSHEQPQQVYQPYASSFPSYNHSYGTYQAQYHPYYHPNPIPLVPFDGDYQPHPYPGHSDLFNPYSTYPATIPSQYHNDFAQDSPLTHPSSAESPMQRMQQLAQQQYGGTLAAQSAAAAAADAAQAARRIMRGKRSGAEETVRDVLHRQYIEQRKREEFQMQQMQQQSLQQGDSIAHPAHSFPLSHTSHASTPSHSWMPLSDPPTPTTPTTPIFTFPVVTPPVLPSDRTPPPTCEDALTSLGTSTLSHHPDVSQQAMVARLKKQSYMDSLQRANTVTTEAKPAEAMSGAPYQPATVVQSLEERAVPLPLSSSRKRPLDDSDYKHPNPVLKPGMRREVNEKGEAVERLYVLVHHCNHNDPDYNPEGVLMPYEEYKKEEERDDMITFSYSSVTTPYEYVDFRVKKQEDVQTEGDVVSQP
ncbi:hypothetical protein PMAYCL1PPCAC_30998 [Pristionchus mayeri]|uniref:Uncharacterized protein n=1 Tax=Pristionchus mayeri TaxID=1317129 RepID=A0AAN5DCT9_9BILA|nr:hypothetical protein PMAYCL1PPCAC_30998 [Pristionchus mayeri]